MYGTFLLPMSLAYIHRASSMHPCTMLLAIHNTTTTGLCRTSGVGLCRRPAATVHSRPLGVVEGASSRTRTRARTALLAECDSMTARVSFPIQPYCGGGSSSSGGDGGAAVARVGRAQQEQEQQQSQNQKVEAGASAVHFCCSS